MTEALYYTDPMNTGFTAAVTSISADGKEVVLDRTLFYPEGGGQPADRGRIDDIAVTDVRKGEDGTIVHILERPAPFDLSSPRNVSGQIDWNHRFEYMQQHTGQHVLSAALWEVAGAATVSVAQGSVVTSIEIDTDGLSDRQLQDVMDQANEAIRSDLPVTGFQVDHKELGRYTLRRPTSRTGKIRLVRIGDDDKPFDLVACGGVHLPRTGMLNLVHLAGVERIRGHQRLHFKIGERALEDYRKTHAVVTSAAERFSAQPEDLTARIDQEQKEVQELRRTCRIRAERIARFLLDCGGADNAGPEGIESIILSDEESDVFKALAEMATERPDRRLLAMNITDDAVHWAVVIGASTPFPAQWLRDELLKPFGAKGGGKPPLWRGVLPAPAPPSVIEEFVGRFRTLPV
jgi:alanyl-tRNA synthetase